MKSPNGGETNKDGSISTIYCAHCYESGEFKHPNMTVDEMQDLVRLKMKEMGFFMALFANSAAKKISNLRRWKNQ